MERAAAGLPALCPQAAVVPRDDLAADVETQTETADVTRAWVGGAVEDVEDSIELVARDADALVTHGDMYVVADPLHDDADRAARR